MNFGKALFTTSRISATKERTIRFAIQKDKYYIFFSEDDPAVNDLVFNSVDDMLDHWILEGRTLREIIPDID